MTLELDSPYHDLTFMSPLSERRAERLVDFLAGGEPATVLDIGCGWAELLLRVVAAVPESHGTGIDLDRASIEQGRRMASQRGLSKRATLVVGDAKRHELTRADAVICIGASQVWGSPLEANQPLDYAAALSALRALVPDRGRVVFGEGIWTRPPTPEAVAPLSGRSDELVMLGDLVEIAAAHRFALISVHEANLDEWDEFESGYGAAYARWLAAHPSDHPDADEIRERARRQRTGYLTGYRGVMGMAYLHLLAV